MTFLSAFPRESEGPWQAYKTGVVMEIVGSGLAAAAAVAGGVASVAIVKVAKWMPRRIEAEWLEGAAEAAAAEPSPPVQIRKREAVLIGVVTAALCALSVSVFGATAAGGLACVLSLMLLVGCVIDFHTMMLPDDITLPLLWVGLLANSGGLFVPTQASIVGAVVGYLVLWCIYWGFKLLTGREGMGYGDFKLLAAIGAWVGWSALPAVALLASLSGIVIAFSAWVGSGFKKSIPVPFGPHLSIGGVAAFFLTGAGLNPVGVVLKMVGLGA